MSEQDKRNPEEWADSFEAIVDNRDLVNDPKLQPLKFHVEYGPIDPDEDVEDVPKYRSLEEAIEAWKKEREEQ